MNNQAGVVKVYYSRFPAMELEITGNTFPVREQLKNLGFTWSPGTKTWKKEIKSTDEAIDLTLQVKSFAGEVEFYYPATYMMSPEKRQRLKDAGVKIPQEPQ